MEGIGIKISRKIRKFRKIKTPPLCGEYPSWVPYISLEGENEDIVLNIILKMVFKIKVSMRSFSWKVTCLWHYI
jgi:hypothetical protein